MSQFKMSIYILIIFFICFGQFTNTSSTNEKSGPYRSSMIKTNKCEKSIQPADPDPGVFLYAELYNTSSATNLIRGNITVVRDYRTKKLKAKGFFWEDGKWKIHYLMPNMACNNVMFPIIAMATGVEYDRENCIISKMKRHMLNIQFEINLSGSGMVSSELNKGVYIFDNLDTNKFQHLWLSTQEYGKIMWRIELYSHAGNVFCWDFVTLIEPDLKKKKSKNTENN